MGEEQKKITHTTVLLFLSPVPPGIKLRSPEGVEKHRHPEVSRRDQQDKDRRWRRVELCVVFKWMSALVRFYIGK